MTSLADVSPDGDQGSGDSAACAAYSWRQYSLPLTPTAPLRTYPYTSVPIRTGQMSSVSEPHIVAVNWPEEQLVAPVRLREGKRFAFSSPQTPHLLQGAFP